LESIHPAYDPGRLTSITLIDGQLTAVADSPTTAFLVIRAKQPMRAGAIEGAEVQLRPGWDGSLGYSLYGLRIATAVAGQVIVDLKLQSPPERAIEASDEEIKQAIEAIRERPSRFPDQAEAFPAWQRDYRNRLLATLMAGGFPERVPLEANLVDEQDYENFRLLRISYRSRADRRNELLLSLPKGVERAPLLLALHGHESPWGEADSGAYRTGHADDFCATFANRGWAVLQPATMDHTLQHAGWTLQGEWTWDAITALDYAAGRAEIDPNRIAVCGLSTGGHLAMNVLALDERVKAGVVGCILSTWNHYEKRFRIPPHCDCGIAGQLSPVMEQCDWAALAAPKAVQYQHGRQDATYCPGADLCLVDLEWNTGVMPVAEYEAMFDEVQKAYQHAGADSQVETHYHPAEHRVDGSAAFDWLDEKLKVR
jgi:poly(3-hydroxybutyrate) depolymerase